MEVKYNPNKYSHKQVQDAVKESCNFLLGSKSINIIPCNFDEIIQSFVINMDTNEANRTECEEFTLKLHSLLTNI